MEGGGVSETFYTYGGKKMLGRRKVKNLRRKAVVPAINFTDGEVKETGRIQEEEEEKGSR